MSDERLDKYSYVCSICTVKELPYSHYVVCHACDNTVCSNCIDLEKSEELQRDQDISWYDIDSYWLCKDCCVDDSDMETE